MRWAHDFMILAGVEVIQHRQTCLLSLVLRFSELLLSILLEFVPWQPNSGDEQKHVCNFPENAHLAALLQWHVRHVRAKS